jgi:prefoldin beta subunit
MECNHEQYFTQSTEPGCDASAGAAAREAKRAQEEIKDLPDETPMYMSVGSVMMQKKKDIVNSKLGDKVETLELRIKSLEKQEKMLQGKFEQLQVQIKAALEGKSAPNAA